jgi:hypothetical protein
MLGEHDGLKANHFYPHYEFAPIRPTMSLTCLGTTIMTLGLFPRKACATNLVTAFVPFGS